MANRIKNDFRIGFKFFYGILLVLPGIYKQIDIVIGIVLFDLKRFDY